MGEFSDNFKLCSLRKLESIIFSLKMFPCRYSAYEALHLQLLVCECASRDIILNDIKCAMYRLVGRLRVNVTNI